MFGHMLGYQRDFGRDFRNQEEFESSQWINKVWEEGSVKWLVMHLVAKIDKIDMAKF